MSLHKIKPKLKKYKRAGLSKNKNKPITHQSSFFLPESHYLNLYLKRLEYSFSNSLTNLRKVKLLLGFSQSYKLNKFVGRIHKKKKDKWRFSKLVGLTSLIERRLDIILFRIGFVLTISQARHLISHRKVLVNNVVNTSSFRILKKGDIISFSPRIKKVLISNIKETTCRRISLFHSFNHIEINLKALKIILVEENLKSYDAFYSYLLKLDWGLLFSK